VRDAVEQAGQVPGHVGVPRVRVRHRGVAEGRGHLEVDAEGLQGGIGVGQPRGDRVRRGVGARLAEALHVDLDQPPELGNEVLHVHAGTAIDVRRPLTGEDRHAHYPTVVAR